MPDIELLLLLPARQRQELSRVQSVSGSALFWWSADGSAWVRPLDRDSTRVTVGRRGNSDVRFDRPEVSAEHASLRRFGDRWSLQDHSRNGTAHLPPGVEATTAASTLWHSEIDLEDGSQLRFGAGPWVRFVSWAPMPTMSVADAISRTLPPLTERQAAVLRELCRPMADGRDRWATANEIAARLEIGEEGVRDHLTALADKFGIESGHGRKDQLARRAWERGVARHFR